jgi:methylmalonyl-CoA/ethylmalonyl-CoA epimerase
MLPEFRFHHIGIVVKDIDNTANIYVQAGYVKSETVFDPLQQVYICFLKKEGMPMLELLLPNNDSSPVWNSLQKNGVSPCHFCYEVDDMEEAIGKLRKMKYVSISKPSNAAAIDGRHVCFLFNKQVGLIELVESKK